jgi:HK97 family phage prohead protease
MLWGAHQGDLELRETGGEIRLSGRFPYATQTTLREAQRGQPELREVFAPRAFSVQSEPRAIYLLSGHDMAKPLASTTNGTLQMVEDEAALSFEAVISPDLASVSHVHDIIAQVRAGLTGGISPGFRVPEGGETVTRQSGAILRTILRAALQEISIVTRPAYPQTQIEARSWDPLRSAASDRTGLQRTLNRWRK